METAPFPGFPTDLQAQLTTLLTQVPGKSRVRETIFNDRFRHIAELRRLGAYLQAGLLVPQDEEGLTVRATRDALAKIDANPERLLN